MSTELFYFVTVVGDTGRELASACDSIISRRRRPASDSGLATYLKRDERGIERLCKAIIGCANDRQLPFLHCATHLDRWATSNWSLGNISWPDDVNRALIGCDYGVSYYRKEHADDVLRNVRSCRRRALRADRPCDSWYADAVATAIFAGQMFDLDYTVLAISEIAGLSGHDPDVHASAARVPKTLRRLTGSTARRKDGTLKALEAAQGPHVIVAGRLS